MELRKSILLNSKNLSLVNEKMCFPGSVYIINEMLIIKNLALVKKFGDKTEFTNAKFHCM